MRPSTLPPAYAGTDLKVRAMKTALSRSGALALTGLLIALAGCTSPPSSPTTPTSTSQPSSSVVTVAALPEESTTVGCELSRPVKEALPVQADDLAFGPLVYPGLLDGYPQALSDPVDGIIFAKIGPQLSPDATVKVSIAPEASSWASIVTENGPPAGYLSVTYKSCPASQHAAGSFWVGGFALRNQTSGCMPLNVQVQGEASTRRTIISFGDKTCS